MYGVGSSRGVVANVLDSSIVVSEFDFHSHNSIHLRNNSLMIWINAFISPAVD